MARAWPLLQVSRRWALLAVSVCAVATLPACSGSAGSPASVCPPSATCTDSGDDSIDADDTAPLVEAGDSDADGSAAAATSCPASRPPVGMSCVGAAVCSYVSPLGTSTASCIAGVWKLNVPPCPGGPDIEPTDGSACTSDGLSCGWPNACGDDDVGVCVGGTWQMRRPRCVQPCPYVEPAQGTGCAPTGVICTWSNDCGGMDQARCLDVPGLWSAWEPLGSTCACPAQEPSGSCGLDGQVCSYRYGDHCDQDTEYICQYGHWGRYAVASPCVCPATPPIPGKPCPPNGTYASANCYYLNADLCTDHWSCMEGGTWPAKPEDTWCPRVHIHRGHDHAAFFVTTLAV